MILPSGFPVSYHEVYPMVFPYQNKIGSSHGVTAEDDEA
jgi:hypothetical protein